jgi:hypothetical protein
LIYLVAATRLSTSRFHYWLDYDDEFIARWSKLPNHTWFKKLLMSMEFTHARIYLFYSLLIVCFCLFFGLCLLVFSLPCTFDGWVLILDFYLLGFSSCKNHPRHLCLL